MKILSAGQISERDSYTMAREPVVSGVLMERAADSFVSRFCTLFTAPRALHIFCGPGNNGGDGLAAARMLMQKGYETTVYLVQKENLSPENALNLERLRQITRANINLLEDGDSPLEIDNNAIIIDALFGTGLSRPIQGRAAEVIRLINGSPAHIVSMDVPSGLYCDKPNKADDAIIEADLTLTFGCPKLMFLMCDNEKFTGKWEVLDIGLNTEFLDKATTGYHIVTPAWVRSILQARPRCSHKGTFGHALLMAGSFGKMGAALLAGEACLRSGSGLLTLHIPECGYSIAQSVLPEAMTNVDGDKEKLTSMLSLEHYKAIGIGPGIGTHSDTAAVLRHLLAAARCPLVLDADALNILAENKPWLSEFPPGCILTPHPKEFERLAGKSNNAFERLLAARQFAADHKCFLILKGGYTSIHSPTGDSWFNTNGNPGMATGGSGDVLTGILTGLLAQGYSPRDAALLGVYIHGSAGDLAAKKLSQYSMLAGDIIAHLGEAFLLCQLQE